MLPADGTGVVPAGTGDAAKRTHTLHLSGTTTRSLYLFYLILLKLTESVCLHGFALL